MDLASVWDTVQDQPVYPPPPGYVPDPNNPESRAYEISIAAYICIPSIVLFAAMRLYARLVIMRKWTWDDVTCTLGVLAGLTYLSLTLAAARGGVYGKHLWEVTFREYSANQLMLAEIFETVYGPFIWVVKLSLSVLYLQVFRPLKWLRYSVYAGAVVTGLFYFSVMIAYIIFCVPQDHSALSLLTTLRSPKCSKSRPLVIALGVVSLISDIYLVILPLPAVWKLQLPLRRKLAVSAMFFTGSVACIASAFALAYRIQLTLLSEDVTWFFVPLGVVTNVEFTAGILVCCMPTTMAVMKQLKVPFLSLVSSYRKAIRSASNYATTERSLSSTTNLQHGQKAEGVRAASEDANGLDANWYELEDPSSAWELHPEAGSKTMLGDTQIRKTTDIRISHHTHKE